MKNKKIYLAIILCITAITLLIWLGLSKNLTYYRTVTEAKKESVNTTFRLVGNVKKGSIKDDLTLSVHSFIITDGKYDVKVTTYENFPALLKDGIPVVAQGKWNTKDKTTFDADSIMVKHGSDYTPPKTKKSK